MPLALRVGILVPVCFGYPFGFLQDSQEQEKTDVITVMTRASPGGASGGGGNLSGLPFCRAFVVMYFIPTADCVRYPHGQALG